MTGTPTHFLCEMSRGAALVGVLLLSFLLWLWRYTPEDEVATWLENRGLKHLRHHPQIIGVKNLREFSGLDVDAIMQDMEERNYVRLKQAVLELDLELWLTDHDLGSVLPVLLKEGYTSREQLHTMDLEKARQVSKKLSSPKASQKFLSAMKGRLLEDGANQHTGWTIGGILWTLVKTAIVLVVIAAVVLIVLYFMAMAIIQQVLEVIGAVIGQVIVAIVVGIIGGIVTGITGGRVNIPTPRIALQTGRCRRTPSQSPDFNLGLIDRIRGQYLDVSKCRVEWNHDDNAEVGGSSVATVHLVCQNSTPYKLQTSDNFQCLVTHANSPVPHVIEPSPLTDHSTIRVSFTTRTAGKYSVDIKVNTRRINEGSICRNYLPGPVDASKTVFVDQSHVIIVTKGTYYAMVVIPKDSFGNTAIVTQEHLTVEIKRDGPDGTVINPECVVDRMDASRYELLLKVEAEGHYIGCVKYRGQRIGPPSFTIICLTECDSTEVEKNLCKKNLNTYYEAQMQGDRPGRMRRVYCYISPKQLQVREYYFRVIPSRLFTCKVCPSTEIILHPESERFTLDDGYQKPLTLYSQHREILGATFYKFVLKNIGGSEKFLDKQQFFFTELRKYHNKSTRHEVKVRISRSNLLDSAMHATRGFSTSEWCKKFVVEFRGEEGLDWGGVSREFFELLCVKCFDVSNGLFKRFKDSPQALVHPNHQRQAHLKLKHYEFAGRIVGKCLYESAMSNTMLVKARFTRSFLAQIIGLRVHHKYFESDDPDLYVTKVQYLKENNISELDLGLVMAEEEFPQDGGPPRVVPLIDHGEEIEVTEGNKMQYLNLLAQYRLAKCAREEIEHFLKGLNDIIPDNLLSIFDENELELLMCGMDTVNYEDLKQHSVSNGSSHRFQLIISWFWTIVSSFTQEEMAKLLQFVTGCSQLPPGGFKELSPRFQITSVPTHGRLPTAHTCFNQLCLPDYDTCEQFQQALMLAINEGTEGFGMI